MDRSRPRRAFSGETVGLFEELELKFDLMRLERLEAELWEADLRLMGKRESLEARLDGGQPGRPWLALSTRVRVLWIESGRRALADRRRRLRCMEADLKFALRLRGGHPHVPPA